MLPRSFLIFIFIVYSFTSTEAQSNAYGIQWSKQPSLIRVLDSLIQKADSYGLTIPRKHHIYLGNSLTHKNSLQNKLDSLKADSLTQNIALNFFEALSYGQYKPTLLHNGIDFKLSKLPVANLLAKYSSNKGLPELVQLLNNEAPEVATLINKLAAQQQTSVETKANIALLKNAINNYRWLHAIIQNKKLILVNLPAAKLTYFENGKAAISMKIIAGKQTTPSATLSSKLNQIVINPYWNVPRSIAVREMLPKIKKDINYLAINHLQVLDRNYKKLSPNRIAWDAIDTINFQYYIRQSTGCDNSLGIIKLDFDSPFGIYLHDTPEQALFGLKNRFLSHGCMRMEKPIQLAQILLKNDPLALDSIDFKNCYKNPNPIFIPIKENVIVLVWYNLIDFDNKGQIQFYKDIYGYYK